MTARLQTYLYGTAEASMAAAVGITVTEPGPVVYTARLLSPALFGDALTALAASLTASALAGTYSLTWSTTAQAVTISATGVASFEVVFGGNLAAALGFASSSGHTGAATYTGTQQALGRFDALRLDSHGLQVRDDVDLRAYRHGRHRAVAWSQLDTLEGRAYATRSRMDALLRSYCAAGLVRLHLDEAVAAAWAVDTPAGYLDATVIALDQVEHAERRGLSSARIVLGVGRG